MLFNSTSFLVFFVVVVLLYYLLPHKHRWILLLVASCIFYGAFVPEYLLILFLIILIDYTAGRIIYKRERTRKKAWLAISIISTCSVLFFFKYFNFVSINTHTVAAFFHWNYEPVLLEWVLPIGLSFHTFQSLSYVIEVYQGKQKPEKHLGIYATYVMFFPQLVAGPIERPQNLLPQFREKHPVLYRNFSAGFRLALYGFFKKMVIADNLAPYVDQVYNNSAMYGTGMLILATCFFAIQIYCDFSGYSDIALGTARILGFRLMTNFRQPYFSTSIPEFWRRWHISLSTWFRDYIYIPLGGNKVKKWRWYYNLFLVFFLSGIWHGAGWTFIIWGVLHWVYYLVYYSTAEVRAKLANKSGLSGLPILNSGLSGIITFIAVAFAWIAFRAADTKVMADIVQGIMRVDGSFSEDILMLVENVRMSAAAVAGLPHVIMSLLVFLLMEIAVASGWLQRRFSTWAMPVRYGAYYALLIWIWLFGVYDNAPHFIYFQF